MNANENRTEFFISNLTLYALKERLKDEDNGVGKLNNNLDQL